LVKRAGVKFAVRVLMALAKPRDRAVIRNLIGGGDHPISDILHTRALDPAAIAGPTA
jgi:hypothetical protein